MKILALNRRQHMQNVIIAKNKEIFDFTIAKKADTQKHFAKHLYVSNC